jgi:hypothetical protein
MKSEGEAAFIDPKGYIQAVNDAQVDFVETVAAQAAAGYLQQPYTIANRVHLLRQSAGFHVEVIGNLP